MPPPAAGPHEAPTVAPTPVADAPTSAHVSDRPGAAAREAMRWAQSVISATTSFSPRSPAAAWALCTGPARSASTGPLP